MDFKAIDTHYNGYKFRSRLEARWAVFFDQLNVPYQYEPEGFDLDGVWYLPDFFLPDGLNVFGRKEPLNNTWIEIKPTPELNDDERQKLAHFAKHTGYHLLLMAGDPGPQATLRLINYDDENNWRAPHMRWIYSPETGLRLAPVGVPDSPKYEAVKQQLSVLAEAQPLLDAYSQARQERFEVKGKTKSCQSCGKRFRPYRDYYYLCPSCYKAEQTAEQTEKQPGLWRNAPVAERAQSSRKTGLLLFLSGSGVMAFIAIALLVFALSSRPPAVAPTSVPTAAPPATETVAPSPSPTTEPAATATMAPTSTAISLPVACDCDQNSYNCTDFQTQEEAQGCFDYCFEDAGDIHLLDEDQDQFVCETLP